MARSIPSGWSLEIDGNVYPRYMTTPPIGRTELGLWSTVYLYRSSLAPSRGKEVAMIFRLSITGMAIILLAVAFPLSAAQGAEALIEGLQIERENGTVMVSFSVKNCFNTKMEEAIKTGVPTTFNFFVTLYQTRPLIWDKKIVSRKIRHRVIYDNLKQDFRIWLQEKEQELRVADLEEAKRLMQVVERFPVVKGQKLEQGIYELAVKAELDAVKLPLGLEGILFFVSLWNFETDWQYRTIRVEP